MKTNPPKKKKKGTRYQDEYDAEKLAELGIFDDADEKDNDEENPESWRNYI